MKLRNILLLCGWLEIIASPAYSQVTMVTTDDDHKPRNDFDLSGSHVIGKLDPARLPSTVVRNYTTEAGSAVNQRINGKTGSPTTMAIFSAIDDTTHVYTRNPSLWCADLDLTCISSSTSANWRITLVTPQHGITAHHVGMPVGTVGYWTDANNATYSRTVSAVANVGGDMDIVTFSAPLPASITPALILPPTLPPGYQSGTGSLVGIPVITHDQNRHLCLATLASVNTAATPSNDLLNMPTTGPFAGWNRAVDTAGAQVPAITGDSSSPYFIVVGNRPVLLGCFYGGTGAGPDPGANVTALQAAIGSSYSLTAVSMPGYPLGTAMTSTIAIGNTSTGTTASVTNSGTPSAAILNFTLPKGDPGIQGIAGQNGSMPTLAFGTGSDLDRLTINGVVAGPHLTGPAGPPSVTFGTGADADRLSVGGTVIGPHLRGPAGSPGSGSFTTPFVCYVETNGNDSTAVIGDPTHAFATSQAAYDAANAVADSTSHLAVLQFGTGYFPAINLTNDWNIYVSILGKGRASAIFGINALGLSGNDAVYDPDGNGDLVTPAQNGGIGHNIILKADQVRIFSMSVAGGTGGGDGNGANGGNGGNGGNIKVTFGSTVEIVNDIFAAGGAGGYDNSGTTVGGNGGAINICGGDFINGGAVVYGGGAPSGNQGSSGAVFLDFCTFENTSYVVSATSGNIPISRSRWIGHNFQELTGGQAVYEDAGGNATR